MTETLVKTFETLDRRGKRLEDVEQKELRDIISGKNSQVSEN